MNRPCWGPCLRCSPLKGGSIILPEPAMWDTQQRDTRTLRVIGRMCSSPRNEKQVADCRRDGGSDHFMGCNYSCLPIPLSSPTAATQWLGALGCEAAGGGTEAPFPVRVDKRGRSARNCPSITRLIELTGRCKGSAKHTMAPPTEALSAHMLPP